MNKIRIKIVRRCADGKSDFIINQFPDRSTTVGKHQFVFDPQCEDYDWLVAIDNLPENISKFGMMDLHCDPSQTILICTEPSDVTYYGKWFANQFEHLVTNQDEHALPHANARRIPNSLWFYGKEYNQIIDDTDKDIAKTDLISGIATDKSEGHTAHKKRFDFLQLASKRIDELEILYSYRDKEKIFTQIFGKSVKYVKSKHEMIDRYKYHLAIGNQQGKNIITERILDCFLGHAVPISFGCTNLSDHFPEKSFIDIDINDPSGAISTIKSIIYDTNDYLSRLESVKKARSIVISKFNLITTIIEIVENSQPAEKERMIERRERMYSRRLCRFLCLSDFLGFAKFKIKIFFCKYRRQ